MGLSGVQARGSSRTAQGDDSRPQGPINQCTAFTLKRLLTFKTHTHIQTHTHIFRHTHTHTHSDTHTHMQTHTQTHRHTLVHRHTAFQEPGERKKALFWAQLTFFPHKAFETHTVLQHTMSRRLAVQYLGDVVFAQNSFKGAANPKEAATSGLNPPLSASQTETSE